MSPMHVFFHRLAAKEYREVRQWYAQRSDTADQSFQDEINAALNRIALNQDSGTQYGRRFRWIKLRRFPYLLFYELLPDNRIRILAVAHGRRRPGYWLWRSRHS